jgi:hypothetical protein
LDDYAVIGGKFQDFGAAQTFYAWGGKICKEKAS